MISPIGNVVGVDPQGLASALRGQEWRMQIEDRWYDIEFTGAVSHDGILLVQVKRGSRSRQLPTIKKPKE